VVEAATSICLDILEFMLLFIPYPEGFTLQCLEYLFACAFTLLRKSSGSGGPAAGVLLTI